MQKSSKMAKVFLSSSLLATTSHRQSLYCQHLTRFSAFNVPFFIILFPFPLPSFFSRFFLFILLDFLVCHSMIPVPTPLFFYQCSWFACCFIFKRGAKERNKNKRLCKRKERDLHLIYKGAASSDLAYSKFTRSTFKTPALPANSRKQAQDNLSRTLAQPSTNIHNIPG
ncbi:hypothetical protein BKA57DRAFT_140949 [Linnemannia elongata]|nr:hypothetical protein BKA57DRAFT_140949 [Linnemannia elongata]